MGDAFLWVGLAAVFLGIVGVFLAFAGGREQTGVARSLAAVEAIRAAPKSMRDDLDKPFGERVGQPFFAGLTRLGRRFTPSDQTARMRRRLDLAGNPPGWDSDRIIAFKMLGLIVGGALGFFLPLLLGSPLWAVVLGIGLALLGFWVPNIVLYQTAYNRSERILKDLPDALDLLVISVESGLGFDAALSQVARNTEGPLAEEFFRVLQEMQLGTSRADSLRALGERSDVSDLRGFITAMVQADSFGIPVANVLRIQAREMRTRRSQRAEEAAQKVPVKILFPLIFCILPVLFIAILGPAVIQIADAFSEF
ncbi:type II secretion system F family protein [Longivirga aurantiaca]|uniref:Type II secretion system F family protein n=1 Tax=Longivirga aurantiaca TaxID=1837743 RepID=A0ABW1T422_9ACTN